MRKIKGSGPREKWNIQDVQERTTVTEIPLKRNLENLEIGELTLHTVFQDSEAPGWPCFPFRTASASSKTLQALGKQYFSTSSAMGQGRREIMQYRNHYEGKMTKDEITISEAKNSEVGRQTSDEN